MMDGRFVLVAAGFMWGDKPWKAAPQPGGLILLSPMPGYPGPLPEPMNEVLEYVKRSMETNNGR